MSDQRYICSHHKMNEYDSNFILLKDFREPSLLCFELLHFRNSLCYWIENNWSFKHKSLNHVVHGDKSHFGLSWDCWSFRFSKLSIHFNVVLIIPNYASTANIQGVEKVYNLGSENFETDYSWKNEYVPYLVKARGFWHKNIETPVRKSHII